MSVAEQAGLNLTLSISPKTGFYFFKAYIVIILSRKRITKAQTRLHGCAGWSAPLLFTLKRIRIFSHDIAHMQYRLINQDFS